MVEKTTTARYAGRRSSNAVATALALAATAFGLGWLVLILGVAVVERLQRALGCGVYANDTAARFERRPAQSDLRQPGPHHHGRPDRHPNRNPGGTYLAEYGRHDRLSTVVRFINDILLSAPSIVVGLFVYEVMVAPMGHFSGWAGGVALSVLVIPVVVRTTEDMLTMVPNALREAATSIGLPRSMSITRICYRAARAGMVTGVLLAIARISGETAPLLFTSLNNQFWSADLNQPVSSLPVVIFQFALSPYKDWQALAWTGALIITLTVLALSITARALVPSTKQP